MKKLLSKILIMCMVVCCFTAVFASKTTVSAKTFNYRKTSFEGGNVSKITKNKITFGDYAGWYEDEDDCPDEKYTYKTTSKTKYYKATFMDDQKIRCKKSSKKAFKKYVKNNVANNCRFLIKNGKIKVVIYGLDNFVG